MYLHYRVIWTLMACFAGINVSQGSVATYVRCGGIFSIHLTANLPRNLPVKKILKSVKIWQNTKCQCSDRPYILVKLLAFDDF